MPFAARRCNLQSRDSLFVAGEPDSDWPPDGKRLKGEHYENDDDNEDLSADRGDDSDSGACQPGGGTDFLQSLRARMLQGYLPRALSRWQSKGACERGSAE
jgi:hypothetical protein